MNSIMKNNDYYILAIETSSDDTCIAILKNNTILANEKFVQNKYHIKYGGVYPKIASKLHSENIHFILERAICKANIDIAQITNICYTNYPGLPSSLMIGKIAAEMIGLRLNIKPIGLNHLYAHLNAFTNSFKNIKFPALGIVISGGHTNFYYMDNFVKLHLLGNTLDDAIGEAFDKIGREMDFPYPGGIILDEYACKYDGKDLIQFPIYNNKQKISFSFSGLKSSAKNYIAIHKDYDKYKTSASVMFAAYKQIFLNIEKILKNEFQINNIVFGGGTSSSKYLKKMIENSKIRSKYNIFFPDDSLNTDNAAMIGLLLYNNLQYEK